MTAARVSYEIFRKTGGTGNPFPTFLLKRLDDSKPRHVLCPKICTANTHLVVCGRGGGSGVYPLAHFSPHSFFARKKNGRRVKPNGFSPSAPPHRPPRHRFSVGLTKNAGRANPVRPYKNSRNIHKNRTDAHIRPRIIRNVPEKTAGRETRPLQP